MTDLADFLSAEDPLVGQVREALRRKRGYTVEALANAVDASPRRVREAIDRLREAGFRIPEEKSGHLELVKVPPTRSDEVRRLPLEVLAGDRVRFGLVSDTHLCSAECALPELHLAYDHFEREGIDTVLHPGDLVAGKDIYRGQDADLTRHTFEAQRDFAIANYPRRDGITTRIIGGNHDLEGAFGKAGADPVKGVANKRPDFDYLGPYEAFLEIENGSVIHLLHGSGGMSYAVSYKAQKLVEGYPPARKPNALLPGHWHVQGTFSARGVQVVFPGCFEWRTTYLARKGLQPAVGFHVIDVTLGDDGSIVRWLPEWFPIWEGRVLAA